MIERNIKTDWLNLAAEHIELRHPHSYVNITPPMGLGKKGFIKLETFVQSKDKERLTLVSDKYEYTSNQNVFDLLNQVKKRFDDRCLMINDKFIFNEESSIYEPYRTNINK